MDINDYEAVVDVAETSECDDDKINLIYSIWQLFHAKHIVVELFFSLLGKSMLFLCRRQQKLNSITKIKRFYKFSQRKPVKFSLATAQKVRWS